LDLNYNVNSLIRALCCEKVVETQVHWRNCAAFNANTVVALTYQCVLLDKTF
jgi:hypothetical protein